MEKGVGKILKVLKTNSKTKRRMGNFFEEILVYEMEGHGWYVEDYKNIISKYVDNGELNEN